MLSRRYSGNTITTYTDALMSFLKFHSNKSILEITNDDVIKFNNEFVTDLRYIMKLIIFNKRNKPSHIYPKTGRLERVCIGYKRVIRNFNAPIKQCANIKQKVIIWVLMLSSSSLS